MLLLQTLTSADVLFPYKKISHLFVRRMIIFRSHPVQIVHQEDPSSQAIIGYATARLPR